ncbi:hypothetical protein GCM10023080_074140 [Streptomyces pseudoechinosporeus]
MSLPRQLRVCQRVLPEGAVITAHFYDVESGRIELAERGGGTGHERIEIPVPRDGGIGDLLRETSRPDRRFDAVICESIDRIARHTYLATEFEYRLEQAGVVLWAADEPIRAAAGRSRRGRSATEVLIRRVKQGVAEWYVTELLEKSWAGFETHAEQGYNVGKPCYGYRARRVPHPVPARRAKGMKKTLLKAHPVEGPVVSRCFAWRVAEELSYRQIAEQLNADLLTHPPPTPVDAARAAGRWTTSSVREVLTNPKYTGHMVWNRRARKGTGRNRLNPVEEWVWSTAPAHEALVGLETFVRAQQVAERRRRSRGAAGVNRHPQTNRIYRLRGYVFCVLCGRRIQGKPSGRTVYYVCAPKAEYRPEGHPPSIWMREDALLGHLAAFLCVHVFGTARHQLLKAHTGVVDAEQRERQQRLSSLRTAAADCAARSRRLLQNMELLDWPDLGLVHEIAARHAVLRAQRQNLQQQLAAALKDVDDHERHRAGMVKPLSQVPVAPAQLSCLPDELSRPLFDTLRLAVRYDGRTGEAVCRIVLPFGVTKEALHQLTGSEALTVRCEVAVADRADAEVVQKQQAQAMVRVLAWLAGQGCDAA